ncbi:MAG TPA: PKD domain-containing protein [Actinomycetota bacterium]|nr:PKD domain-containing protein [Actinomycetota bacterium]
MSSGPARTTRAVGACVVALAVLAAAAPATALQPPDACFETRRSALEVAVDATCTVVAGDMPPTYAWEWGDGSPMGSGQTAHHRFDVCPRGDFTIVLTVTAADGSSDRAERQIVVADRDRDGDALPACREELQGTTDGRTDWDRDGLSDLTESRWFDRRKRIFCGRSCAYPNPVGKDIFVEVDRMRTPAGHSHGHGFPQSIVRSMRRTFLDHGIDIHFDQGRFGGGNLIPHDDLLSFELAPGDDVDRLYNGTRSKGFSRERRGFFHYVIVGHGLAGSPCDIMGLGEAPVEDLRRYGDLVVIFRDCLERSSVDEMSGLVHIFLQELGHNLFGAIEPRADRYPCSGSGFDRYHDRYQGYAMWPFLGGGGMTYHPGRWSTDMHDMGRSIKAKVGFDRNVNKLFERRPGRC